MFEEYAIVRNLDEEELKNDGWSPPRFVIASSGSSRGVGVMAKGHWVGVPEPHQARHKAQHWFRTGSMCGGCWEGGCPAVVSGESLSKSLMTWRIARWWEQSKYNHCAWPPRTENDLPPFLNLSVSCKSNPVIVENYPTIVHFDVAICDIIIKINCSMWATPVDVFWKTIS